MKHRRRFALAVAALLTACTGGEEAAPRPPLRVASLLPPPPAETLAIAGPLTVTPEPLSLPVDFAAAEVGRLRVEAGGDARLVRLEWRLDSESSFSAFRHVNFPTSGDGSEHVYEIDLRREPYWSGRIAELRLRTAGGRFEVTTLEGFGHDAAARVTSLHGLTVPSLPGAERLVIELPETAPRRARFVAWIGLLPRFDRPAVTARFAARFEPAGGGEPMTWVEEAVAGAGADGGATGWRRVSVPVRLPAGGGRLTLEAFAELRGGALPAGSAMWGAPMLLPERTVEQRTNLLVVVLDTVGAGDAGAWSDDGGESVTPNLDAFAAEGLRFADLTAPAPWTLPSIATLLTGLPPEVHGAGRRVGDFAPTALTASLPTLAESLAAEGYYTAAVYNNIYLNQSFGLEQGFDEYAWVEDDDAAVVDRAVERLAELADRPHFLFVHLFGAHHPYEPPAAECERVARARVPDYAGDLGCHAERLDVPTLEGEPPPEADRAWVEALYAADLAHTDAQLGRLLAAVDDLGLRDDTVVAVISDHGEVFYDRLDQLGAFGYEQADHGHTLFRDLLRVPAALRVPGREPRVVERPAEMADLLPTLLARLGVEPPPHATGRDLVAELDVASTEHPTRLASTLLYGPARWSIERGSWKLVAEAGGVGRRSGVGDQLYDLSADPGERQDVAAMHPDVAANMRSLASRELANRYELRRRLLTSEDDVVNSAYLEWVQITKLRALGYLQ